MHCAYTPISPLPFISRSTSGRRRMRDGALLFVNDGALLLGMILAPCKRARNVWCISWWWCVFWRKEKPCEGFPPCGRLVVGLGCGPMWGARSGCDTPPYTAGGLMLGLMKRDSQLTVTSQPRGRLMATPRCELLASTPHRRTRPVIADTHSFQRTSRLRIFSLTPTAQLDGLHTNGQLRDKHRPAAVKAHGPIPCIVPLTITPLLPINIEL